MLKLLAYSIALSLAAAPALAAGPKYYHQTAAPATCTVGDLWIDTDATAGNQISTCTAANTWTKNQSLVGDCTVGPCLDGSADGGNLIKLWAGTGSYWTALQGGTPEANRSWRLPIAAAPATGETLVMTMDEYGQMGFLPAPETSGYVLSSTDAGVLSWAAGGSGAGDDLGSATYPSAAGVANWGGSAWGTSYTVGTAANNLVQLNASAQLPAVSADLLTITDAGIYFTTDTVGAALQELGGELAEVTQITLDASLTEAAGVLSVTHPVTSEAYGAGWAADTEGAQRDDIYAILHVGDTDDDGMADKLDLASAGFVKTTSAGVISSVKEKEYIGWSVVNSDTATAVADGKLGAAIPAGMNGMNLVDFTCSVADLNSAASGATTVVLRRVRGGTAADMTSTGVTIDYNEYTASDETVDTSNDDLATGDKLYVDIPTSGVTSPAQKGLHCTATFEAP